MAVVVAPADVERFMRARCRVKTWRPPSSPRCTEDPRLRDVLERQDASWISRREFLELQRRGKAHYRSRSAEAAALSRKAFPAALRTVCLRSRAISTSAPSAACPSALTPPSARARVLMPFGGKYQRTPGAGDGRTRSPSEQGDTDDCSFMAWGYNPLHRGEKPLPRRVSRGDRIASPS